MVVILSKCSESFSSDAESSAVEARGKAQEGEEEEEDREGGVYPVDPLQSFADYYLQAERSVEALLHIR